MRATECGLCRTLPGPGRKLRWIDGTKEGPGPRPGPGPGQKLRWIDRTDEGAI
jgi:hypothetical protein